MSRWACALLLAPLVGCAPILVGVEGDPCTTDADCAGLCWQAICHGVTPRRCDPERLQGQPCLRPARPGEGACHAVRVGRWLCSAAGETVCRVDARGLREVPENGCDDDQDTQVDEPHGECSDTAERVYFAGYTGQSRVSLDHTRARIGAAGVVDVDPLPESDWREPGWSLGLNIWTSTSTCALPPPDDPLAYAGRWVRWRLPALPAAARYSVELHQFRGASTAPVSRPIATRVAALAVPASGAPVWLSDPDEVTGTQGEFSTRWGCVDLPAGVTTLYFFDHLPDEGCPCDANQCLTSAVIAPHSLVLDLEAPDSSAP